ncbi:unnamed protein product, partial [Polarella glacialis]
MRVRIATIHDEHGKDNEEQDNLWSAELELAAGMSVQELKHLLSGPAHGLGISKDTKVLSRRQTGLLFTLQDAAKVTADMLLRGVTVPGPSAVPKLAASRQHVTTVHVSDSAGAPVPPPSRSPPSATLQKPAAEPIRFGSGGYGQPGQPQPRPGRGRSWLRMVQHVWSQPSWMVELSRGPGRPSVQEAGMTLGEITLALSDDLVQKQLDTLFADCGFDRRQLETSRPGGLPRIVELVRCVSKVLHRSSRPVLERRGRGGDSLASFVEAFQAVEAGLLVEEISMLLGSFQFMVWMGGPDPRIPAQFQKQRQPRKQAVRSLPSSIFLAYMYHAALPPLERRKRAGPRAISFLEMMLREYAKTAGEIWSKPEAARTKPLVVWLLNAQDSEEGHLARTGYFEDVAGLVEGEEERITLYLVGSVKPHGFPCGRRVRVHVVESQDGAPKPDLVVCLHSGLGCLEPSVIEQWLPWLAPLLGRDESQACDSIVHKPIIAFTSRCESMAQAELRLLEQLGLNIILSAVRNLFSGMAAGPQAKYDDHGWVTAVQGSTTRYSQLSAEQILQLDVATLCSRSAELCPQPCKDVYESCSKADRSPAVFWGILDLKYDPRLLLEGRVKVLETGDGRSSKFSGYGAAIKEKMQQDHKLEEALHRAVLVENKKLTHDFFEEGGYGHIQPKQLCLRRIYSETLASDIIRGLALKPSDCCILKLCNRCRAAGVIPLQASELDEALKQLLHPPENVEAWLAEQPPDFPRNCTWGCFEEQLRHWWSNECPVFLVEELCVSAPTQLDGSDFDGTMRVAFSLHRVEDRSETRQVSLDDLEEDQEEASTSSKSHLQQTKSTDPFACDGDVAFPGEARPGGLVLEWLGGYWKLPGKDMSSTDLSGRIISKAKTGTAPTEALQLHEVYAAMGNAVELMFTNTNQLSPQNLLRRYPDNRELGAFIAARLACSMRMRDPTKSKQVMGLAQASNVKGSSPSKEVVDSYIHRNFGVLEALMGRWKHSAEHFRRSLVAMPTNSSSHYLLGMHCLDAEDWTTSIRHFQASLQLDPDFKAPWVNSAVAWLRLKEWRRAVEACDACLNRHPQAAHCFYNKGLALFFEVLSQESEGPAWKLDEPLREEALKAFDDARANLERASMWTPGDDQL